jgi:hypothetical protein
MRRERGRLLLVGAAVATAVAAGSPLAHANPEFYSKAAIGGKAGPVPIVGTAGVAFLEGHASKAKIECKKATGGGEVVGPTESVRNVTTFAECEIAGASLPCENRGAGSKAIETKKLRGELGALSSTKPGVRLTPESGTYLAEFECAGGAVLLKVKGSLTGELTGASGKTVAEGKIAASGDLKFAETGGIQKYTKFVGEATGHQLEDVVKEGSSEHEELAGQSVTAVIKSVPANNLGETL